MSKTQHALECFAEVEWIQGLDSDPPAHLTGFCISLNRGENVVVLQSW